VTAVAAIFGPTASGKSAVAVALARLTGGEIVNCDAMQLYRGLPILTNQPSPDERAAIPHHLVGVWPLDSDGDIARYAELAHAVVDDVLARGRVPIVCGGSGLYLRAAIAELPLPPALDAGRRAELEEEYDRVGAAQSHARLAAVDAPAAARIHPNDRRRVVRALGLYETGTSLAPEDDDLWAGPPRRPTAVFGLRVPRAELRLRIAERTTAMFAAGVEEEARAAVAAVAPSHTAARMLGLDLLLSGEPDAADRLTQRTRAYARRQETWMRRIPGLIPVDGTQPAEAVARTILARL
jgi:tRNA dimethylallyltransferase